MVVNESLSTHPNGHGGLSSEWLTSHHIAVLQLNKRRRNNGSVVACNGMKSETLLHRVGIGRGGVDCGGGTTESRRLAIESAGAVAG